MSSGKIWSRPPVLLALCLVSVGGVVTILGRLATGPAVALKRVELSNEPGAKAYPAFAPDGQRLAYSARATSSKDEAFHIFIRDVTVGGAQQLTAGPASDISPVWSPDGNRMAFVRMQDGKGECVVIPVSGGGEEHDFPGCTAPGDETQPSPALAWMRDGQSLVVVQASGQQASGQQTAALAILSLADGKFRPLTHPPAGAEDTTPAVSPDGNSIAFVRSAGGDNANIFVTDSAGANPPHAVTFDGRAIRGVAWTRDGQDLVYTGQRVGMWRLWRVPAYGGSPRDLIIAGRDAQYVAVSPVGNRLVYTVSPTVSSIWRAELGNPDQVVEHAVIRSPGREFGPRYSPSGKTIADISDQTGNDEIWLSDADGGNRVQVTSFKGPELARIRWSPDGKSLIFDTSGEDGNDLYIVPAVAGGQPKRVQSGALNGSWSHDGKSMYFQSHDHIWKAPVDGGEPQQIRTSEGAAQPVESVDGKYVYFRRWNSFWRVPVTGGEEEQAITPDHDLMWATTLQPTKQGMYYIEYERSAREPVVSFFDYATKKSSVVFHIKRGGGRDATYSVSPDGKYILYARVDQSQTNLEVVENFR
jgi:Tol biopolymer transport system component